MRRALGLLLCTLALSLCCSLPAHAQLSTQLVEGGYSSPLFVTAPPGDTSRLYVVEQGSGSTAAIKIVNLPGDTSGGTFQTIGNLTTGGERGLLGLAFHPSYATNNLYYTYQTNTDGHVEVREYLNDNDPDVDMPARTLLTINRPRSNHNGGWIGFGPDNLLYIASGDSGGGDDPDNLAQSTSALQGKILRIDVNPANPLVPAGNPFGNEVLHYGLRNPFRSSFDRANGNLYIGDVGDNGDNAIEEVNFAASGATGLNYGWRPNEGAVPPHPNSQGPFFGDNQQVAGPTIAAVDPIHQYNHLQGGFTIIGGYMYRGTEIPSLVGTNTYFFGDLGGAIWSITYNGTGSVPFASRVDRTTQLDPTNVIGNISSFGEDAAGRLYIVDLGGEVYRIIPEPGTCALLATAALLLAAARFRRRNIKNLAAQP